VKGSNAWRVVEAGANALVAGSAVWCQGLQSRYR
jgi:pentose-5-phosphate-3-epimerase